RGMRVRVTVFGCTIAVVGLSLAPAVAGGVHDAINFNACVSTSVTTCPQPASYRATESQGSASIVVERGTHGQGPATVDVTAAPGSVTDGSDFRAGTETVYFSGPIEQGEATVALINDVLQEDPETVQLSLSNATGGAVLAFPRSATLTIIDDDGPSRISFEAPSYTQFETKTSVQVTAIRSGVASGAASVSYATQDGTATAGSDYQASNGQLTFDAGQRVKKLTITLQNDSVSEGDESFSLAFSNPTGAELASPSTTNISISDDDAGTTDDTTAPYTAFHQPLHGDAYTAREIRRLIAFMQDNTGGSGMDRVQLALRKNLAGGACAWWNGSGFRRAACTDKRWTKSNVQYFDPDIAIFTLSQRLKPSFGGSGIKNYTAFSRGWDKVGNVQTTFIKGQNKNTFEVRRG
ncbi:MAG: hypothetical protein M3345_01790, partial [Actinomycetota bacterium]|nr:hypothetical protein [Actinomycetota bacterium]